MIILLLTESAPLEKMPIESGHWTHTLLEHLFVGLVLPASILAVVVLALVLVSLLGAFSLDFKVDGPDVDVHVDPGVDVDPGLDPGVHLGFDAGVEMHADGHDVGGDVLGGFAAATMKAVHLDRVPLMAWLAVFSLFLGRPQNRWVSSYLKPRSNHQKHAGPNHSI